MKSFDNQFVNLFLVKNLIGGIGNGSLSLGQYPVPMGVPSIFDGVDGPSTKVLGAPEVLLDGISVIVMQ